MRVYDPLYGVIKLSKLEYSIISSPEIQRLRYVRMCNINSLLVTGASEISRFEHIIGVLHLAHIWVENNGNSLKQDEKEEIYAAALLHDFQTGPFGHSLQYVFEDNDSAEIFIHDDIVHGAYQKFHQSTDANASFTGRPFCSTELLGNKWDAVATLIKGEGKHGPLISGTVDIDNIDNVIRLAYHVGIATTDDAKVAIELAQDLIPTSNGLEISGEKILLLEKWQQIRRRLYELLLLDWAEFSAKAMLTRAMELAVEHDLLGADSWLKTDLELLDYLGLSRGESQEIPQLAKRIKCGDLYTPICLTTSNFTDLYLKFSNITSKKNIEDRLSEKVRDTLKLNLKLLIHPILDNRKTDRSVDVVIRETKEKRRIGTDSKQLLIGVFISKELSSSDKLENLRRLILSFLVEEGMTDISYIKDPMIEPKDFQMELLC